MTFHPLPLTIDDLNKLAQSLENQANSIRTQIRYIQQTQDLRKSTSDHYAAIEHYAELLCKAAKWDKNQLDSAVSATPGLADYPRETLTLWAKRLIDLQAERKRLERDREILRLARRGHTNKQIAARMECSTRTVTKAITAQFRTPRAQSD